MMLDAMKQSGPAFTPFDIVDGKMGTSVGTKGGKGGRGGRNHAPIKTSDIA